MSDDAILLIGIFILVILSMGEPDLMDALIHFLMKE